MDEQLYEVSLIELKYVRKLHSKARINSSQKAFEVLKSLYNPDTTGLRETFFVLFLNKSLQTLQAYKLSEGGTGSTTVDIKFIVAAACLTNSSGVILSHNHPSLNWEFSKSDIAITEKIRDALKLVDVGLFDHILFLEDNYVSMADSAII